MKILNVGYNNSVMINKIVAMVDSNASPMKRLREEARRQNRLIDATNGHKTRAIIITNSHHVILSSIQPQTLAERIEKERD